MFVSIVLNTEYHDINMRDRWFLKNLCHCYDNKWILVTHEYLLSHINDFLLKFPDNLFRDFEMRRLCQEEIDSVEIYTIPDSIFHTIEKEHISRSGALTYLSNCYDNELGCCYNEIFTSIQNKHPDEKIHGVFHCLEADKTIRRICEKNRIPLISYIFSAFRKPHGYQQTMYCSTIDGLLFDDSESKQRYDTFIKEDSSFPVLDNKELVALLGKTRTLPLLQLMGQAPAYELGVCCECFSILPHVYERHRYTDDDIFYKANKLYAKDKIAVRSHSLQLDEIHVDRSEVRNDPASFILSCKRLITVRSQIILKAMLWGRTAIMEMHTLPYSFLCQHNLQGEDVVDLKALNYIVFGFLVPSDLMFSDEYWKWRLMNPSETEIYQRHLEFLINALGIEKEKVMQLQGKERLRYLLECRRCDEQLIDSLLSEGPVETINWEVASSRYEVVADGKLKTYWRINTSNSDGSLTSKLSVMVNNADEVRLYLLDDVAGFTRLKSVIINGHKCELDESRTSFKFMPKTKGGYPIKLDDAYTGVLTVECTWEYKKVFEFLNTQN